MMFVVLAPLLVFIPRLAAVKRVGLDRYGTLAERYAREFDQKWIHGRAPADHPFLGSTDIQSLADLDRSYEVVKSMWLVPINLQTVARLAVTTLLPVAPLTLTMISFEQLLGTVLKFVF
jgi:hypothetical protein